MVRDEAHFIEDCLKSLAGTVDDVIVIDTGSADDTVAISQQYGARLGYFAWCNDFSAARNHALAQVEHEWVLYIDADERLMVPDMAHWRACLADATKAALNLRLHPKLGWTGYSEMRVFRNDLRIKFAGEIHERIQPAVQAVCAADGLAVGDTNVSLQHVGYEADQRPKLARNIPLLQAYLAREPDRVYCWWHLGEQHRLMGEPTEAMAAWQNGVAAVLAQPHAEPSDSLVFAALVAARYQAGLPVDDLLAEALGMFPGQYTLLWMAGKRALERGAYEQAQQIFSDLAAIDPAQLFDPHAAYDHGLFTHMAQESLAITAFRAGAFAAAAAHYRQAALTSPDPAPLQAKAALASAKASVLAKQSQAQMSSVAPQ
ncbi:MAG: glycosyltransferase [Acidocella sp.]|nr:glycosyltransferase [Acidocella sp.]